MKSKTKKQQGAVSLLLRYYAPHKKLFAIDMGCTVIAAAVDVLFPIVSRQSMRDLLPNGMYKAFFAVMAIMFVAYILKAWLNYVITYVGHTMGTMVEADMRRDIFRHMQKLSFSFYDKNRTGVLMSRVTSDLFNITELAHHGPENLLTAALTILGAIIVMFVMNWKLALVLLVLIPLFLFYTLSQRNNMMSAGMEVKKKTAGINASIESSISGVRTAKAFANEECERNKFDEANGLFKSAKGDYYKAMGKFQSGMEFIMGALQVVVIAMGGLLIMRGSMDYIDLVTFTLYVSTFISPVRKLSMFMELYTEGMTGISRFQEIMGTEPEIKNKENAQTLTSVTGSIRYENVCFSYDDGTEVLKNIDLDIKPGESFALVGPSGGGKTTMCHLLPRFYDVTSGRITVDGVDVRDVTQESLRRNIGIIQQDVFMFAGTIMENIRYGRPDATDEEVMEAAKRAEIHSEIMDMPNGYDSYIGERGVMLSGGQKQRISIARVFLKNPPVLILDEATSALDSVTEQKIQSSLDELGKGRTCIIIAHRLSTIRNADRIAVVEGERILEQGSHDELMAKNGEYAALWQAQLRAK